MSEKAKWAALRRAVDKIDRLTRRLASGEDVAERLAFWVGRRKAAVGAMRRLAFTPSCTSFNFA